jgi:hypothetical protein
MTGWIYFFPPPRDKKHKNHSALPFRHQVEPSGQFFNRQGKFVPAACERDNHPRYQCSKSATPLQCVHEAPASICSVGALEDLKLFSVLVSDAGLGKIFLSKAPFRIQ